MYLKEQHDANILQGFRSFWMMRFCQIVFVRHDNNPFFLVLPNKSIFQSMEIICICRLQDYTWHHTQNTNQICDFLHHVSPMTHET